MNLGVRILFLCMAFVLWWSLPALAVDVSVFVSPDGNDTTGTGTESNPWRTITHALTYLGSANTIEVMDDGDEGSVDYTENVNVSTASVTIKAYEVNGTMPWVNATDSNDHVFEVLADYVTISGLRITGAESVGYAGVYLGDYQDCVIENNEVGVSTQGYSGYNKRGIYAYYGSGHVIRNNLVNHENTNWAIYLSGTDGAMIHGNQINGNVSGLYVGASSNANTITSNRILYQDSLGIALLGSTNWNAFSNNTISGGSSVGMAVENILNDTVMCCNIENNTQLGIRNSDGDNGTFRFFMNNLDGNGNNVGILIPGCSAFSPFPLRYGFAGESYYGFLGNYYGDKIGTDADLNGVFDTPYTATNYTDTYPLFVTPSPTHYDFGTFTLERDTSSIGYLREGEYGIQGATMDLPAGGSLVFRYGTAEDGGRVFFGGSQAEQTTWHGWLTFTTIPSKGYVLYIDFGTSDAGGGNFVARGSPAGIMSDGWAQRFDFTAARSTFAVPDGSHLAMRVRNPGAEDLGLHVGGVMALVVPPEGVRPGSLFPVGVLTLLD